MLIRSRIFNVVIIMLVLTGCQKKTQTPIHEQVQPVGAVPTNMITGKVVETIDSGGYTYVRVNNGTEDVWAAGPLSKLKVGDRISFPLEMPMDNFTSESLEKTFTKIYFVNRFSTSGVGAKKSNMMSMNLPAKMAPGAPKPVNYEVEQVPGWEGGITIAELYRDKNKYNQQTIRLRGRVVKFTPQIMGKNWIHIQDGTDFEGSFDLTVTSNTTVNVDDIVVVEGKVILDKDFGFGYKYDVLVVQAEVTVE